MDRQSNLSVGKILGADEGWGDDISQGLTQPRLSMRSLRGSYPSKVSRVRMRTLPNNAA